MSFLTPRSVNLPQRVRRGLALCCGCAAIVRVIAPNQALATDTPDIGALQLLFSSCAPAAHGWDRLSDNDNVRYTRWAGQSPDGRRHQKNLPQGETVFPHEGASDARIPAADEVINEQVDYLTEGFWRAMARVQGNPQTEASGQAAYARKLIEWIKGTKLYGELVEEIELHAQNACTYGTSLLQVGWERTLAYRYHTIKLGELMAAAQQRTDSGQVDALTLFPQMILDPTLEEDCVAILQQMHAHYVQSRQPSNYEWDVQPLSAKRARQAIHELRKDGEATLPLPYLCRNQPFVRARKLWEDAFIPETARDIQSAQAVFLLDYYTEAQLRAQAEAEEWDPAWLESAVKLKGQYSEFSQGQWTFHTGDATSSAESSNGGTLASGMSELIEVTTCLRKLVDADGVLAVYSTIYHGNINNAERGTRNAAGAYAAHGPLDYPLGLNYPLVQWRFEVAQRALCATRGIPQIMATWQNTLKAMEDATVTRTNLETCPPILVEQIMGVNYRFGPFVQVPVKRGSAKPEFMQMPGGGKTAEFMTQHVQGRIDRYFGRPGLETPPELSLIKRQKRVRTFLLSCSQALSFCFKLMSVNLPPEQIEQITGLPRGQFGDAGAIADDMLYLLTYDVQELSPDFRDARNKRLFELAQTDRTGTIDMSKLIAYFVRSEDPAVAAEVITDQQGATAAIFKQVKGDFDDMLKGIPPQLTENDPTAEQQMKFAEQIMQVSPVYQQAAQQPNGPFLKLLEAWMKSKQFSRDQLGVNKVSGRVGVDMSQVMQQQLGGGVT